MEAITFQALEDQTELGSLAGIPKIYSKVKGFFSLQGTHSPLSLSIKSLTSHVSGSRLLREKWYNS